MNENSFSMGEAVRFGWDTARSNVGFFIGLLIVAALIENLPGIVGAFAQKNFSLISIVLSIAGWLLGFVVQMGLLKVSLKFCDGTKGKLDDLLSSFNLLFRFIAASFLYALIMIGGFLLLIIPGIIWSIKFSLFPYFIVDRDLGPIEALKASGQATDGAKGSLFLFGSLLILINFAGALVLFVGLFVTIPLSMVAYAYVYRELSGQRPEPKPVSGEGKRPGPVISPKTEGTKTGGMYINLGY